MISFYYLKFNKKSNETRYLNRREIYLLVDKSLFLRTSDPSSCCSARVRFLRDLENIMIKDSLMPKISPFHLFSVCPFLPFGILICQPLYPFFYPLPIINHIPQLGTDRIFSSSVFKSTTKYSLIYS